MATNIGDIVKQGYVKVRSRRMRLWQRRWLVLCRASERGPCRLEKYHDERSARLRLDYKVAVLTSVTSVVRLQMPRQHHAFLINFQVQACRSVVLWKCSPAAVYNKVVVQDGSKKCLATDSDLEADCWAKLLGQETSQSGGPLAGEPDLLAPGLRQEMKELFPVFLLPSPRLDSFGECLLQVTPEHLHLWECNNPRLRLAAWPLTSLRRYGVQNHRFTFEAGRQCPTGEGLFVFHTLDADRIYTKVHQATLAIALDLTSHHQGASHLCT